MLYKLFLELDKARCLAIAKYPLFNLRKPCLDSFKCGSSFCINGEWLKNAVKVIKSRIKELQMSLSAILPCLLCGLRQDFREE